MVKNYTLVAVFIAIVPTYHLSAFVEQDEACTEECTKNAPLQQQAPLPQGPVQYIYVPYVPGTAPVNGMPQPIAQQVAAPKPQPQPAPNDDGPNVAQVMATFAGVLGGIVAMGMGAEYDDPEKEAQGLNMFIQNGTHLITLLTKQPCSEEKFIASYMGVAKRLARARKIDMPS